MNLIDDYMNKVNQRKEKEKLIQEILFGQVTGLIITIVAFLQFLSTTNRIEETIMILWIIIGILFFIAGVVSPYVLCYASEILKKTMNKVFQVIFLLILIMMYVIFVIPVGLLHRKKWIKEYGFSLWNSNEEISMIKGFEERKDEKEMDKNLTKKNNRIRNVYKIIGYFIEKKHFVLMPLLCVFILLGLLFFFITSSVVTPMIYTLF